MPRRNYPKKTQQPDRFKAGGDCTGKVKYKSMQAAQEVIKDQEALQPDLSLRTYRCPNCGNWHLTRRLI